MICLFIYVVGLLFTFGVLIGEEKEYTWVESFYVVSFCVVCWPVVLGICACKAGLSGNKK